MSYNEEIQNFVSSIYEDIRSKLIQKYNIYKRIRNEYEPIFEPDISKQFLDMVHSFLTAFITNRTLLDTEIVKIYVQDKFTFDNIERIISDDGQV